MHTHTHTYFDESMKLNNFSRDQDNRRLGPGQPSGGITYKAACLVHRMEGNHPTKEVMPCILNKNWQQFWKKFCSNYQT